MKKRNWICPLLTEFYPANECLLGLNIGGGGGRTREIKVCVCRATLCVTLCATCGLDGRSLPALYMCIASAPSFPVLYLLVASAASAPVLYISNICPCSVHQDHSPLSHACSSHL